MAAAANLAETLAETLGAALPVAHAKADDATDCLTAIPALFSKSGPTPEPAVDDGTA